MIIAIHVNLTNEGCNCSVCSYPRTTISIIDVSLLIKCLCKIFTATGGSFFIEWNRCNWLMYRVGYLKKAVTWRCLFRIQCDSVIYSDTFCPCSVGMHGTSQSCIWWQCPSSESVVEGLWFFSVWIEWGEYWGATHVVTAPEMCL